MSATDVVGEFTTGVGRGAVVEVVVRAVVAALIVRYDDRRGGGQRQE